MDTSGKAPSNELRRVLHSAYTLLRSLESNKAVASLTLDHLIQQHITNLKPDTSRPILDGKGESLGNRVSRWDLLNELEEKITKVVQQVEDAKGNEQKLKAMGIYEVDGTTNVADAKEEDSVRQALMTELKKGLK